MNFKYLKRRDLNKVSIKHKLLKVFSFRNFTLLLLNILIIFTLGPVTIFLLVTNRYSHKIYKDKEEIENTRIAIVFGAGLKDHAQSPGYILQDRIMTAVDLYKAGKIQKIIMSGDNRFVDYNEPQVMIDYALGQGIPEFDLQPDFAGRSTYDTCYRAKKIFGVNKAILISQEFHLPRALYLCNSLGVDSVGLIADKNLYQDKNYYRFREFFAIAHSFWKLYIVQEEVVLGDKISI